LPFLLFVSAINRQFTLGFYLAGILFLCQALIETKHQIEDYENDLDPQLDKALELLKNK